VQQPNRSVGQVRQSFPAWLFGPYFYSVDVSQILIQRLTRTIDLPADIPALRGYLDTPLSEEEKIPLCDNHINSFVVTRGGAGAMCSRDDLLQLFRSSEVEEADAIATRAKSAMSLDVPPANGTERSYISFWDQHIALIISQLVSQGQPIRNSHQNTDTASLRPDYGYVIGGVCVFRGEEKRLGFTGTHPKAELFNKLVGWYYDPAPYVFGRLFHLPSPSF